MVKIEMNGIKIECETVEDAERILKALVNQPQIQYVPMPPVIHPSPWVQPDYVAGTQIIYHPASDVAINVPHPSAYATCGHIS